MPVTPPRTIAVERFDPKYLTDEDLDDLVSFTGLNRDACLDRVQSYSMAELAKAWREAEPRSPEEMLAFYRSTDLYVWEQMQWHSSPDRDTYWHALQQLVSRFPPDAGYRRVFEFGAGIGTDALYLASEGYEVTLVDVEGPAFRFAKHRFDRRGIAARFVESNSPLPAPDATYDRFDGAILSVWQGAPDMSRQLAASCVGGRTLAWIRLQDPSASCRC